MMPSAPPPEAEKAVAEFLAWNAQQRAEGYTIANLMLQIQKYRNESESLFAQYKLENQLRHQSTDAIIRHHNGRIADLESDREALHERVDHHGAAIIAIKRRIRNGSEDREMDTGQHDLAAIQMRLAEQERKRMESERVKAEEAVWWKRTFFSTLIKTAGALAALVLTIIVTLAIANAGHPEGHAPEHPTLGGKP